MEQLRRSTLSLVIAGNLAVGAGVIAFQAKRKMYISSAQLLLQSTGTGAGNTCVQVKKNGNSILSAALSIASAAATKYTSQSASGNGGIPEGTFVDVGDVISIDVTSIPGTTASANGTVLLETTQVDV